MGKIVVIGASPNPARYSYKAIRALLRRKFEVVAIGTRVGQIGDLDIITHRPVLADVDMVMLYINAEIQRDYYDYIVQMNPGEILFNPGTENAELAQLALTRGIEIRYDCALVLLDGGLL